MTGPIGRGSRAPSVGVIDLDALIERQRGLVARRQLRADGAEQFAVRDQVGARRGVERTLRVISTTTGPLSREQLYGLAVLHAGPRSLLGGLTAAAIHGLQRWERDVVTVLVDDELDFEPV